MEVVDRVVGGSDGALLRFGRRDTVALLVDAFSDEVFFEIVVVSVNTCLLWWFERRRG